MCHQSGVIWAGFGHRQKMCKAPIGKYPIGTPLGVCPIYGYAYSLREYLAHLRHTFRTPNACDRTPCHVERVRQGSQLHFGTVYFGVSIASKTRMNTSPHTRTPFSHLRVALS